MQFYDVSQTSLAKSGSSVVEEYLPLWMSSGTSVYTAYTGTPPNLISDGTNSMGIASTSSETHLFTLNANWKTNQLYAFEASVYINVSGTLTATLWDVTANNAVAGSSISSSVSAMTIIRSGTFTLIPGHSYGVSLITTNNTGAAYITDPYLIAFT